MEPLRHAIAHHLILSGREAEDGFPSGEEDEDTLTGDLFRALRRRWSRSIAVGIDVWRWRITTRKFRGRGELATESLIGADGIVQVEVSASGSTVARKGFLFQAKKRWHSRDQRLLAQVQLMERHAPGGSAVFDYTPEGYYATSGLRVLTADGRPSGSEATRLGEFLASEFLECTVGRRDTYYEWEHRALVLAGERHDPFRLSPQFLLAVQIERVNGQGSAE